MQTNDKIKVLRKSLAEKKIDAWIVPGSDPHQSEYVAAHWKAREWLSGFTGSAGMLVITHKKSGLWTDSRYFIQAEKELAGTEIQLFKIGKPGIPTYLEWLRSELKSGAVVGFDGSLFSVSQVKNIQKSLSKKNIKIYYHTDLVGLLWHNRPQLPAQPVVNFPSKYAGESRVSKISRIRDKMRELKCSIHIISSLDDIAWIFNIRGTDIAFNPVVICYAVISENEVRLFINSRKIESKFKAELQSKKISFSEYEKIFDYVKKLADRSSVLFDPDKTNQLLKEAIPNNCHITESPNISINMKACKNNTELNGFRNAHIRDGAAKVKWLYWLKDAVHDCHTEVTIAEKLDQFRSLQKFFQGLSFPPIIGYRANAAIVHYSAKPESAAALKPEGLLLVDSRAHYLDGTTDITRTISLGNPTTEEKYYFTLVLKGHIALAKAVFPENTTGAQLDTLTRNYLWQNGLNYGHGTGHGIGHFLNVHEGPQQFRATNHVALQPGMVTTNEPGIYFEGKFGIRIENIMIIRKKQENEFGSFLEFETITFCPIDQHLIDLSMLIPEEKDWLNHYHVTVYEKLQPFLTGEEKHWLINATAKI